MRSRLKKALRLIRKGRTEMINLLTSLINSVDPKALYPPLKAVQTVERWLESKKVSFREVEYVRGFKNIVVEVGDDPERGVVFLGHLDIVPPGDMVKWTHNPFRATRAGSRVYGRGTCDMKGGVTAMLYALYALLEAGHRFEKGVTIALTSDEELGGMYGTGKLVEMGEIAGKYGVVGEPTGSPETGHAIYVGDKGFLWVEAVFHGRSVHGGLPVAGHNPIEQAVNAMYEIKRKLTMEYVPDVRIKNLIDENIEYYRRVANAINIPVEAIIDAVLYPTVSLGWIRGGEAVNLVPDKCEVGFDIRIPYGLETSHVFRILEEYPEIEGRPISGVEPTFNIDEHLISIVKAAYKDVYGGEPFLGINYASSDAYYLRRAGIKTVLLGPGSLTAHTTDEYIEIDEVIRMARVYATIMAALG